MSTTINNNNNGALLVPPPPFTSVDVEQNTLPQTTSPSADNDLSPSLVITVLVLATAIIVSASIYLLLKFVRRSRTSSSQSTTSTTTSSITTASTLPGHRNHHRHGRVVPEQQNSITDSLPLFTYASLSSGNSNNNADCAVCLSKFEPEDRLRLLPACCHAFHADCIDAWLITNQTCPLCRSSIFVSESDLLNKIAHTTTSSTPADAANRNSSSARRSGSFRVEIGSVSRRRLPPDFSGRSYSIGSFEYVLDDDVVVPESAVAGRRPESEYVVEVDKQNSRQVEVGESLAAEIGGGRGGGGSSSWLKDYVDRLAWAASVSLSSSLRSSGRFFGGSMSGSSRRTEISRGIIHDSDLEASRQLGDEIGEMFRWLSGV